MATPLTCDCPGPLWHVFAAADNDCHMNRYAHHGIHNTAIAETIAKALADGLHHPGNPAAGEPPNVIILPMFRTAGMPPQMVTAVNTTAQTIADAIVYLIETREANTIISTAELRGRHTLTEADVETIRAAAMTLAGHNDGHLARQLAAIGQRCQQPTSTTSSPASTPTSSI